MEPSFWSALSDMAAANKLSLADMIAEIDARPRTCSLTSAVRVAVLNWARGT
ncbi:MAG: ribbon-helix-helix domain-containing protein [Pseudomonadota bacterium]|nr:ribbon-helix-helix domain-containing protein [Pseudomonadota bacterium]